MPIVINRVRLKPHEEAIVCIAVKALKNAFEFTDNACEELDYLRDVLTIMEEESINGG